MTDVDRLKRAAAALYYACCWIPDREVDEARLWTELRDALGLPSGTSPRPMVDDENSCRVCGQDLDGPATAWNPAGLPPRIPLAEALDDARHSVDYGPRACGVPECSICGGGLE